MEPKTVWASLSLGGIDAKPLFSIPQFDEPEMLSSESRTVPKSSEVSMVSGANVRFYGKEICVAVTKVTELEKHDGIDRSSSCEKSCFGVGSGTRLEIYSGTFGRPSPSDPACCFSGRIKTLRFFIPAPPTSPPPSYECVTCGPVDDCNSAGADSSTETCQAGEKCFTLKLQRKETSEVVTIKGCSHVLRYWGKHLDCDYQCKSNVRLWPDTPNYHYSVCASCCQGNKCNAHSVSSGVSSYGCNFFVTTAILSFVVYSVA